MCYGGLLGQKKLEPLPRNRTLGRGGMRASLSFHLIIAAKMKSYTKSVSMSKGSFLRGLPLPNHTIRQNTTGTAIKAAIIAANARYSMVISFECPALAGRWWLFRERHDAIL
jgi:hypothetical protein